MIFCQEYSYFSPIRTTRSGLVIMLQFSHKSSQVTMWFMNFSRFTPSGSLRPPHRDKENVPRCWTSDFRKLTPVTTGGPPMAPSTEWGETGREGPVPDSASSSGGSILSLMETNLALWNLKKKNPKELVYFIGYNNTLSTSVQRKISFLDPFHVSPSIYDQASLYGQTASNSNYR